MSGKAARKNYAVTTCFDSCVGFILGMSTGVMRLKAVLVGQDSEKYHELMVDECLNALFSA